MLYRCIDIWVVIEIGIICGLSEIDVDRLGYRN